MKQKTIQNLAMLLAILILLTACSVVNETKPHGNKPSSDKSKVEATHMKKEETIVERDFIDFTVRSNADIIYKDWEKGEKTLYEEPKYSAFRENYWKFAAGVFSKLDKEKNMVFSPLSAYIPLSELSYAMDDNTPPKNELVDLLRKNAPDIYWTKKLMDQFRLSGYLVASSVWISDTCNPDAEFLKNNLVSDIYRINFAAKDAPAKQMAWINKWTKGFLTDQVKEKDFGNESPQGTELACRLIGTTYVKDAWEHEFFKEGAKDDTFYLADGSEVKTPFLHGKVRTVYRNMGDYELIKVPMKSGSFIIALPTKESSLEKLLQRDIITEIAAKQEWEDVIADFKMPDFSQSSRLDLLEVLTKMGYHEITTLQEGYAKLVGKKTNGEEERCMVSKVLQESKIEVKKEGIQAASYTEVEVVKEMAAVIEETREITMEVDRPYLYIVTEDSGLPSFIGVNHGPGK